MVQRHDRIDGAGSLPPPDMGPAEAPARRPRVLVVGPMFGPTLETARSTARAARSIGVDARLADFSAFEPGWNALSHLPLPHERRTALMARYAEMLGGIVVEHAAQWKPDLVLALAQALLSPRVLDDFRAQGVATAFWFVENGRVLPYWAQVAGAYDVFFAIQPEPFLGQLRQAGARKAVYLPTACDRRRHVPVQLTDGERRRFGADVSFAGSPYLNRRRTLGVLEDLGLRLWGDAWRQTELARLAAEGGRHFTLDEMVRIFAATAINVNLHSADEGVEGLDPSPDYVNPRTFEVAACGAFQLVDERWPLPVLFTEQEIVTFRTAAELRDKARYYLDHAEERMGFAARARLRALAEHTFEHRLETILRETLPADLGRGGLRPATAAGPPDPVVAP